MYECLLGMLSDSAFVLHNLILAVGVDGFCCNCDKRSLCATNLWFPDLFHAVKVYENNVDIIHGDCILRCPIPAPNPEIIAIGFYLLFLCLVLGIF